ncbi:hypothetical protein KJ616_02800, partial [Patescibacteria group bacterium]|nr:hypothetical protein [Patescibacteria group bacterium]
TLTVGTGATVLGGTLDVTGATGLADTLAVTGTTALTGALTATGGIVVPTQTSVAINGTSTLAVGTGATTLGGTLAVTGAATFSSTIQVGDGTIAAIPTCDAAAEGTMIVFTDAASATDCGTGSGATRNLCICADATWTDM